MAREMDTAPVSEENLTDLDHDSAPVSEENLTDLDHDSAVSSAPDASGNVLIEATE